MDKPTNSVDRNNDDADNINPEVSDIEQLLSEGKSLDEILNLDASAAGGQGGSSSSVANAIRFTLNADEVIPLAGFDTQAASAFKQNASVEDRQADTMVDAQPSIEIVDGGDGVLNSLEIASVTLQGSASGFEGPPGSLINIEISNQNGLSLKTNAVTNSQGQYQITVDLSQYQDGDQLTATATLSDLAANQLTSQDNSLVDLNVDGNLSLEIEDGGDGLLNDSEQIAVTLSGRYQGNEALAGNEILLSIKDSNGQEIQVKTTIDAQGQYRQIVDLSEFSGRVIATATAFDDAGNNISAEDQSRIDGEVEGTINLSIEDGGDELLNAEELQAVKIQGQVDSSEVQAGDPITIVVQDQSGNKIEHNGVILAGGRYEVTLDLSHFQHGDLVEAQAEVRDLAGNTLSAEDTSRIDSTFIAELNVNIADGGDEIINIVDAANTTINGQLNTGESHSANIQLIIEDQSGGRIERQVSVQSDGQYSLNVDFSSLQQGDRVSVTATAIDDAGNPLKASDTSNLEAQIIIPLLQANDDQDEFHGQLINGNVLTGPGADIFSGPTSLSSVSYRGVDIDFNLVVSNQNAITNNGQTITYSVSSNGQLNLTNQADLSILIFDRDGNYQFKAGTQDVDQHEDIGYTITDGFGQSDSARLNLIVPTSNPDTITGTNLSGGDTLFGLDGNDTIDGLAGNDNIDGGGGWDVLHGNEGDDVIAGQNGFDQLFGDEGNDTLNAGNGKDKAYGGEGDDIIDGGSWDDLIDGGTGNDTLIGNTGMDIILGGDGDDNIDGGRWDDSISGGNGDDTIRGGRGLDVMDGGQGNDVFIFSQADNLSSSSTNQDTIYNFNTNEDHINLSDLLVNYDPNAGDDITDFLDIQFFSADQMLPNTDHLNSIEGNVRPTLNNGITDTVIRIDIDGDGSFNGNTQEIVLADLDLSHLGNTEAEIIQALLNGGILSFD